MTEYRPMAHPSATTRHPRRCLSFPVVICDYYSMASSRAPVSPVIEEYLEAIYNIAMEGDTVVGARLAEKFRVSPPTVTATLKRMRSDGFLMDTPAGIALSTAGKRAAESSLRRHRLCERFLSEVLGMDWCQAHEEAHHLEHGLTPAMEERMFTVLGNPRTCPHGNPIPGGDIDPLTFLQEQGAVRLTEASPESPVRVVCISEVVEDESALLRYLGERGMHPGAIIRVTNRAPGSGPLAVRMGDEAATMALDHSVAHKIWVAPVTRDGAVLEGQGDNA